MKDIEDGQWIGYVVIQESLGPTLRARIQATAELHNEICRKGRAKLEDRRVECFSKE